MAALAALEARVLALETDEDFANKAGPAAPVEAAGSEELQRENARLAKENAEVKKLLAKERYRITHLIRTIESLSA